MPADDRLGDREPNSSSFELARKLESWNGDAMLASIELLCKLESCLQRGKVWSCINNAEVRQVYPLLSTLP